MSAECDGFHVQQASQRVSFNPANNRYTFWMPGGKGVVSFDADEYDAHLAEARKVAAGSEADGSPPPVPGLGGGDQ